MPRRIAPVALLVIAVLGFPRAAGAAPSACSSADARGFLCSQLSVPLDREGVRGGTLRLRYALERPRSGRRGWLLALAGGPGQAAVSGISAFQAVLAPMLDRRRLVVVDQRGTGATALVCPSLQALDATDSTPETAVPACAARLGDARADYTTADSVEDIEALRVRLGADKLAIAGISYGTYVAAAYARRHPDHVERLILDSPVGPDGLDPFLLDSYAPLKRIVDGWCRPISCPRAAADPWLSLADVVAAVRRSPISARVTASDGRRRTLRLRDEVAIARLVGSADLNPAIQALLPAALADAAAGRPAPLVRLLPAAEGAPSPAREFSMALNTATECAETPLPYEPGDDAATRAGASAAAIDAVDPGVYAPFSRDAVLGDSLASDCLQWPAAAGTAAAVTDPLPAVPALILSGSLDQRTPTETARALSAKLPGSTVVTLQGSGHDTLDSDTSGCIALALRRFSRGAQVGAPCSGRDIRWRTTAPLPATVAAAAPVPGRGLSRAQRREIGAIVVTLRDAELHAYALLYGGFAAARGGGLTGGSFTGTDRLRLAAYESIPGVKLTTADAFGGEIAARLPRSRTARIRISGTTVRGTLAGRAFSVRARELLTLEAR
ncbi:MAG: alpha/beta fold hydrolase [Baekduia sp.]